MPNLQIFLFHNEDDIAKNGHIQGKNVRKEGLLLVVFEEPLLDKEIRLAQESNNGMF